MLFAADATGDWKSPATWAKAHPGYGITVQRDYFEQECAKAQATPAYENSFRRLLLNQWTEQDSRWLAMDAWDGCRGELPELQGRECWAGLDLASTTAATSASWPSATSCARWHSIDGTPPS